MLTSTLVGWISGGIGAFVLGVLIYRRLYKYFFWGYDSTKIWVRRNKDYISRLIHQNEEAHVDVAEQIKLLHGQVFDALFTDYINPLMEKIRAAKDAVRALQVRLDGLDTMYMERTEQIVKKIEEFWSREINKYKGEAEMSHERMISLGKDADGIRERLEDEKDKVAEMETRQHAHEAGLSRIASKLEEYKNALPSALESIFSLWLVFLLIAIDFYFANRALQAFMVQLSPLVRFLATSTLIVPLIALFDLIYNFSANNKGIAGKMVQFVTFGVCIVSAAYGIPDLFALREGAGGDLGLAGHSLDSFVLKSLPLVAYLVAHFIHQWQRSGKRTDALIVFVMYIILSLQLLFAKTRIMIFGSGRTSNPKIANMSRELASKLLEIKSIQERISDINDKLIPDINRKKTAEIQVQQKQLLGHKERERGEISRDITKADLKVSDLEMELSEVRRGSTTACQRFITIA